MRILHVGFGFRPWIVNGLVIYSESVMHGQVRQGHEVGYFFPARQIPLTRRPFLHRWERCGVQMFEWVNSSLIVGRHSGTPEPDRDLDHPPTEAAFRRVLDAFRPDTVHIHDLGGLPSSLIEIARRQGAATVMTIHDYQSLCPTVKLYDAHHRICMRPEPGAMCAVCCAGAPTDNREELARTLVYARRRLRAAFPPLDAVLRRPEADRVAAAGLRLMRGASRSRASREIARSAAASPSAYQRRRDVNVERLSHLDGLIASSQRSLDIYRQLGVSAPQSFVVPINPPHIEKIQPKGPHGDCGPLKFVALNAANSTQKGADIVVEALSRLSARGLDSSYRLIVHGAVASHVEPALAAHPSVEIRGDYRAEQLDELLEDGDVGLFPSVWEEVYGFVALEFLAKGIPVIGNSIGAIPERVQPGQTGWLNRSRSAEELADLMAEAIADPAQVRRLSERTVARRGELIVPFGTGLKRLSDVYRELGRQYTPAP